MDESLNKELTTEDKSKVCQYCGKPTIEGEYCSEDCLKANNILKKYRDLKS